MIELRHKTLHKRFSVGVPAMLVVQAALGVLAVMHMK
jgi:uncharacterized membrane protein YsdA (DUF1294 family)